MSNHVHFLMVPSDKSGLAKAVGETHRCYTNHINQNEGVLGHLFQERFHSFPIQCDEHLLAVARYIERNPVRAKIVRLASDYAWSSAQYRIGQKPDLLVTDDALLRDSAMQEQRGKQ